LSRAWPGARNWGAKGSREFWPDGAKLAVSIAVQFEAGAHPVNRTPDSPVPTDPRPAPARSDEYGFQEGIPRLLEVFHRRRVRTTFAMLPAAVDRNPQLAKEIVERGHEAAIRGQSWAPQYAFTAEEERAWFEAGLQSIVRASGERATGCHAPRLRGTSCTLDALLDLGLTYYSDDAGRDQPLLVPVRGKPLVVVPCAIQTSDTVAYECHHFSSEQYAGELKNEFEMLYSEAESRRRMMSIVLLDRLSGRPARAKVLEEFIIYVQRRPGVVFMRGDEIARFALASSLTPQEALVGAQATTDAA
jgi:peptidoglycan/xylan/chitin deacetylase (PgdA/CDA1 family)